MSQLIDLGKLRFHFAGDWNGSTTYESNDVVKYGGNVYVYTYGLKTSGNIPTDTTYWALMIQGFKFRGVFDPAVQYRVGDGIAWGGKVYIAVLDSTAQTPPNATYWSQFADGIQYEGAYDNTKAYQRNDVVTLGGVVYIAKVDTTGNNPTNATYWDKLVDGISAQGVYNAGTAYVVGDLVAYGSNIYRCKTNSTGNLPTNATYWTPFLYGYSNRGVWNAGSAYKIGEIVTYGGSTYQALQDNTNANPSTSTSNWTVLTYGFKNAGAWATATAYITNDVVAWGGNTYIALTPHASTVFETDLAAGKWQKFSSGIRWMGAWATGTQYLKDDIVKDAVGSAYIATTEHTAGSSFTTDKTAGKWITFVQGGSDVLPAIPANSGGVGFSLTITDNGNSIAWQGATTSANVYYVGPGGIDDVNHGKTINAPFASLKYACQQASAGNATIFVKTGTYSEQLPITVPANTAIVGDNQRTVTIQPKTGMSDDGVTPNANATMFLMSDGSILNKMTFKGMTGWTPGTNPSDVTTSTIRGVVVRLNPASPITYKSPYVLECAAICQGAIGALIDGSVHASGAKTMIFHGYTVISDNGIGYWVKDGGKAEIVSCFTYYCYFGYTASGGGFIRALNGNNSYGTWGATSRGYDVNETPVTGAILGQQLNFLYSGGNINVGDTVTSSAGGTAVVTNVQTTAGKLYVKNATGTFASGNTITTTSGGTGTVTNGALENQKGFVLVLNNLTAAPKPGASISLADDTYSYVVQSVSGTWVDATSQISVVLAQEKPSGSASGTAATIRYKYSQIRLTGHDFLSIGTGGVSTTNYPGTPTQPAAQGNETDEAFPGRVYYVSTDQDGNFRVGEYFRIDQATGRATLNASAFDLSGLTSLRLGSIGAQLGETINEFSSDGTLSDNSNTAVPTEQAVKTYVDNIHAATFEPTGFNRGDTNTMGVIEFSYDGTTVYSIDKDSNLTTRTDGKFATGTAYQVNATAKTLVMFPAPGQTSFSNWQSGKKYTYTTMQKKTLATMAGTVYFFFDQGSLVSYTSITGDYIQKQAFAAIVYINDAGQVVVFGDERHGITMDGATHYYLHTTTGTRFRSGLGVAGLSSNGTTFTGTSSGIIYDEDIIINIPSVTGGIEMLYMNGTGNNWTVLPSSTTIAYKPSTAAKYNLLSAGSYSAADIPAGNYAVMYFVATNCRIRPVVRIMGQKLFTSLAAARESAQTEPRDTSTIGLPMTEFLWMGAVVVDSTGAVQTLDNNAIYVDLRYVNISSGTNSSSAAVISSAANTYYDNTTSGLSAGNVQAALDTLTSQTKRINAAATYFYSMS